MNLPKYKQPGFVLEGDGLILRPLQEADATERYLSWLNDPETTRYLETRPGTATPVSLREYIRYHVARADSLLLGIFVMPGEMHVGNIKLEPILAIHSRAVLGIMIGDGRYRGRGVGSKAIGCLLKYCFSDMGMNRIELGVTADNVNAIACYEKLGFQREGVHRQATRRECGFVDNYAYAMLRRDAPQQTGGA